MAKWTKKEIAYLRKHSGKDVIKLTEKLNKKFGTERTNKDVVNALVENVIKEDLNELKESIEDSTKPKRVEINLDVIFKDIEDVFSKAKTEIKEDLKKAETFLKSEKVKSKVNDTKNSVKSSLDSIVDILNNVSKEIKSKVEEVSSDFDKDLSKFKLKIKEQCDSKKEECQNHTHIEKETLTKEESIEALKNYIEVIRDLKNKSFQTKDIVEYLRSNTNIVVSKNELKAFIKKYL